MLHALEVSHLNAFVGTTKEVLVDEEGNNGTYIENLSEGFEAFTALTPLVPFMFDFLSLEMKQEPAQNTAQVHETLRKENARVRQTLCSKLLIPCQKVSEVSVSHQLAELFPLEQVGNRRSHAALSQTSHLCTNADSSLVQDLDRVPIAVTHLFRHDTHTRQRQNLKASSTAARQERVKRFRGVGDRFCVDDTYFSPSREIKTLSFVNDRCSYSCTETPNTTVDQHTDRRYILALSQCTFFLGKVSL